ncbi:MAG TPA: hypothetical protein VIM98_07535 [Dyella sp.]|uniref:hypothetical protein n=1 Tax=Dyella sp. TaxID=1869338 RepID=UPI002F93CD09
MTQQWLTALSVLFWWVLYGSIGAIVPAIVTWLVLRWTERCPVVFNRAYLACLLWNLAALAMLGGMAAHTGHLRPPYGPLLASNVFRWVLVANMLVGAMLLWRLIPRADAHRIRLTSACMAVAVVTALGFGIATSLAA